MEMWICEIGQRVEENWVAAAVDCDLYTYALTDTRISSNIFDFITAIDQKKNFHHSINLKYRYIFDFFSNES